jgi:hypothetical protein
VGTRARAVGPRIVRALRRSDELSAAISLSLSFSLPFPEPRNRRTATISASSLALSPLCPASSDPPLGLSSIRAASAFRRRRLGAENVLASGRYVSLRIFGD